MALAYYCPDCEIAWPSWREYQRCPKCHGKTRNASCKNVLTTGEAAKLVKQIEFQRFYRQYDMEREGPTPEDRGRREAVELARKWREAVNAIGQG